MRSAAQIEASRANGAKSKGPLSIEGKARSSQNARRHGLAARLNNEDETALEQLRDEYYETFNPINQPQCDLVDEMVVARWRMYRIWALESATIDHETDRQRATIDDRYARIDEPTRTAVAFQRLTDESRVLDTLHRYETRYRRQYDRALNNLLKLQNLQNEPGPTPTPVEPPITTTPQNRERERPDNSAVHVDPPTAPQADPGCADTTQVRSACGVLKSNGSRLSEAGHQHAGAGVAACPSCL